MASAREIAQELFDEPHDVATVEHALRGYAASVLDDLASQADIASEYADARRSARETWLEVRDDLRRRAEEERRG